MHHPRRTAAGLVVAAALSWLASCGEPAPTRGADGRVDATPRTLAAVVIDHLDGEPRRETGHWSDWNDPLEIEAQVDYGEDPEGGGEGETRTVRVTVASKGVYSDAELRAWFRCAADDEGRCEEEPVEGGRLLYRWWPGVEEEEPGGFGWTVVRDDEIVVVTYEPSGYYREDPRTLDLWFDPDDLRGAALDPAMSLRTTTEAHAAGEALESYEGVEERPEEPDIVATTPEQLAARFADYAGLKPVSVRPSRREDFGPDAVGAHLEFAGTRRYDPFTVDLLTTVGRVRAIDPLPCRVQRSSTAGRDNCFAWDADTAMTWTLAEDGRPGTMWIVGAQDDDTFNRVESVGIRIASTGITQDFFVNAPWTARLPVDLLGSTYSLTADLSVGPATRLAD